MVRNIFAKSSPAVTRHMPSEMAMVGISIENHDEWHESGMESAASSEGLEKP